jgi:hypothetical protein
MKALSVKFPRNPRYTPASLSEHQLCRIEWLAKAYFKRTLDDCVNYGCDMVYAGKDAVRHFTTGWSAPLWKHEADLGRAHEIIQARKDRHSRRWSGILNADGKKYFSACYGYLIAVARNAGELPEQQRRMSRRQYAELRNGYGHF